MWFVEIVFWGAIFLILYTYALYPVVLMLIGSLHQLNRDIDFLFEKVDRRVNTEKDISPSVTVVIAAYNEEKDIGERVKNLLQQDYSIGKLKILIGSDGSSDSTVKILEEFDDENLSVFAFEKNRGKVSVLNDLISHVDSSDILVLSDANTHFESDVISKLVRHFANDNVGAVCGELNLVDGANKENRDSLYWRYERLLKFHEGRIGGLLGANGANYAIRAELYEPLPEDTLVDDFPIVMNIAIRGYQVKYDSEAIASEVVAPDIDAEFGRRVRIGMGNYQSFVRFLKFLWPKPTALYFCYFSHKVLRWFVPHLMVIAIITNFLLYDLRGYDYLLTFQLGFYLFYALVYKLKSAIKFPSVIMFPLFIIMMNIALATGFFRFIRGKSQGAWDRTAR